MTQITADTAEEAGGEEGGECADAAAEARAEEALEGAKARAAWRDVLGGGGCGWGLLCF